MASRVVRARLDGPSEQSLALPMREGLNESEAVRAALQEAAGRRLRRSALRDEAARLAADPTALLAPTARSVRSATFRPQIELDGEPMRVLVEQLRAVDVQRLDTLAGRLDATEQHAVDEALELMLALR